MLDAESSALDAESSALDAESSALDAETSALGAATSAIVQSYQQMRYRRFGAEFSAISAIAVLV